MAAIKPRTARVTIYQGDDLDTLAQHDAKVAAADDAVKRAGTSSEVRLMHQESPVETAKQAQAEAAAERDAFALEAEARGVLVVMHAVHRKQWRTLMDEHGPRDGVREDEALGVNMSTLPDVLLPLSVDRDQSTIEGDTVEFLDSLGDYDYYDRLFLTAFALNRGSATADPTRRLASATSQTSSATSS